MQKILILLMYNLYSDNYSTTSVSLKNYHRDQVNDDAIENNVANKYRMNNNNTETGRSFEFKLKVLGSTTDDNNTLDTEAIVPLKNFE